MSKARFFRRLKPIGNRREHNEGLKRRYDLTVRVDAAVLAKPRRRPGQRGRGHQYSDMPIETGAKAEMLNVSRRMRNLLVESPT